MLLVDAHSLIKHGASVKLPTTNNTDTGALRLSLYIIHTTWKSHPFHGSTAVFFGRGEPPFRTMINVNYPGKYRLSPRLMKQYKMLKDVLPKMGVTVVDCPIAYSSADLVYKHAYETDGEHAILTEDPHPKRFLYGTHLRVFRTKKHSLFPYITSHKLPGESGDLLLAAQGSTYLGLPSAMPLDKKSKFVAVLQRGVKSCEEVISNFDLRFVRADIFQKNYWLSSFRYAYEEQDLQDAKLNVYSGTLPSEDEWAAIKTVTGFEMDYRSWIRYAERSRK